NHGLIIASHNGLTVYRDGEFNVASQDPWATSIRDMVRDGRGVLWFAGRHGLWSSENEAFREHTLPTKEIYSVMTHSGKTYVGATGRLYVLDGESEVIELPLGSEHSDANILDMDYHRDGYVWLATTRGLFQLQDNQFRQPTDPRLKDASVDLVLVDEDLNLWFHGPEIFGRIYPDGSLEMPEVGNDSFGFRPKLTRMFKDQDGTHWHTSVFFGFGAIQNPTARRVSYSEGLGSTNPSALFSHQNLGLVVGTDNGIVQLDGHTIDVLFEHDFSADKQIRSIGLRDEKSLLVGTEKGLYVLDLQTGDFSTINYAGLGQATINGFLPDHGHILVATNLGIFDLEEDTATLLSQTEGVSIQTMLMDSDGLVWVGTNLGLARLDTNMIRFQANDHSVGRIIAIAELPTGYIVAASANNGLLIESGEGWHHVNEASGLIPESIIDLKVHDEHLWIVTAGGVFRTPNASLREPISKISLEPVVTQLMYKGFPDYFCCKGLNAAVHRGVFYVSTHDGVLVFDTQISVNQVPLPEPYIKTVEASGEAVAFNAGVVEVKPDNNQLRINYSALALTRGEHTTFRYRVPGFIDEWVEVGKTTSAQFQEIPPGNFRFELQASGLADTWGGTTAVEFTRFATLFETVQARLLILSLAVVLGIFLVWMSLVYTRSRRQILQTEIQERVAELKRVNSELTRANQELRQTSQIDPLTGLVNRRYFDPDNHGALAQSMVDQGLLLMVDIDFFKKVNDSFGHNNGDDILCQFADVLTSVTRQSDLIVRWGGDEFLLICQSLDDDAGVLLNRVCDAVKDYGFRTHDGRSVNLTCSIGCVRYPLWQRGTLWTNFDKLMEFADAALYSVKQQGRDGWAMLRRGSTSNVDIKSRHINNELKKFVDQRHLVWVSSRPDLGPSAPSSVTHLDDVRSKR
ncbi:MAG: diguanylate cyclase, partial [Pseudomonadota bacterium]